MKKKQKEQSNNSRKGGEFLDTRFWTPKWTEILSNIPSYTPRTGPWPIHLVLPIPEKDGTLVIYDQEIHCYSKNITLTTLYHDDPNMIDLYPITSRTLERLPFFQKRRHPMVNPPYVLFPLNNALNSIWINPLSIEQVWDEPTDTYIKMASGPGIIVQARKRTIIKYALNALMALACSERDMNFLACPHRKNNPLNYLDLPDTPFLRDLSNRRPIKNFPFEERIYRDRFYTQMNAHKMLKAFERIDDSEINYHSIYQFIDKFE